MFCQSLPGLRNKKLAFHQRFRPFRCIKHCTSQCFVLIFFQKPPPHGGPLSFQMCDFFACPRNVSKQCVPESWSRIVFKKRVHHTCLRNMFNRNLSQKRGKEMSSRRDMFNTSLMEKGRVRHQTRGNCEPISLSIGSSRIPKSPVPS